MPHPNFKILFLGCMLSTGFAQSSSPSTLANVTQAFSQAKIVPNVLGSFSPTALINMTFAVSGIDVTTGMLLTESQTAVEPSFRLVANSTSATVNQMLVLALVDPDAPTPQNSSIAQYLHFLAGNFRTNAAVSDPTLLTNQSAALMDFVPPSPPAGSDPHRYVLTVFVQPSNFNQIAPSFVNTTTSRQHFNLTNFVSAVSLGSPIAGNFFFVGPGNSTANATSSTTSASHPSTTSAGTPSIALLGHSALIWTIGLVISTSTFTLVL